MEDPMRRKMPFSLVCLTPLGLALPASAGHHPWDFSELFSNSDGTVQFIEMFSLNNNEAGMNGIAIAVAGGGTFNFAGNLPSAATANTGCSWPPRPSRPCRARRHRTTCCPTASCPSGAAPWATTAPRTPGTIRRCPPTV
jgi:hypothetical protein